MTADTSFRASDTETLICEVNAAQNVLWELCEDMKRLGINEKAVAMMSNAIDMLDDIVAEIEKEQG